MAAYFEKTERKLRHPEWPCLDLGNKAKPLAVPIELCTIVEGQRKGALDGTQTSEVLRFAKKVSGDRLCAHRGAADMLFAWKLPSGCAWRATQGLSPTSCYPQRMHAWCSAKLGPRLILVLLPHVPPFLLQDPRQLVDDVKRRAVSIGRLLSGQGAHSAGKEWGLSLQVATSSRERESPRATHMCRKQVSPTLRLDPLGRRVAATVGLSASRKVCLREMHAWVPLGDRAVGLAQLLTVGADLTTFVK